MKRGKLSFGISLNNRASVFLGSYTVEDLPQMAEVAEELSYDSAWVGDSLIDSPWYEPLTLLGAVASRTSDIKIGASIIQPHFRHPLLLALSWATLDRISKGRTILTLGIGGGTPSGVAKEAEIVGIDMKKRGIALEENVEILRKLWSGETVDHNGQVYKLKGIRIGYSPLQNPPPIWVAAGLWIPRSQGKKVVSATPGYTRKEGGTYFGSFDRVGRLADGWFTIMATPENFKMGSEQVTQAARKHGRKPEMIRRAMECWINVNEDRGKARNELEKMIEGYFANPVAPETVERWSIYGTEHDCLKRIEEYQEAGVEHLKFIMGSADQLEMCSRVGKSILPSF